MSLWSRMTNVFRPDRLNREIDEELASHLEEAAIDGRDPAEARRAFGSILRQREQSRDVRLIPWLDSLRSDTIFGWRQLKKRKITSAAAILSLGIAIGACTSAFRLIDALLLRPLPIASPERLYEVSRRPPGRDPALGLGDVWAYPAFRLMRAAAHGDAELIAISYGQQVDLTYRSDEEMEKAHLQYVSGRMFDTFGLRPALGRLLSGNDDLTPHAHPVAVLSHDYWSRRFGQDPGVIGRKFRMGDDLYEIVGVLSGPFTGTEPGTFTDVFVPAMMSPFVTRDDATWHRTFVSLNPGKGLEPLRQKLDAASRAFEAERAKGFTGMSAANREKFVNMLLLMEPAAAGASGLQRNYRRSLQSLALLVALVLLIACANVANLLTAQAAARSREMALRVSIGAGRSRLVQLVLVESGWLAVLAGVAGALFAWWSAPFVVSHINPPDNPARIALPADWRVLVFGLALILLVTLLFGLAPALRASSISPAGALKGGSNLHTRRRSMNSLIALQVAFCFFVIFVAGLFAATFNRLSHRPIGFSTERLLTLQTFAQRPQPAAYWDQTAEHLRSLSGVEKAAFAGWDLPGGRAWNGFISVNGAPPGPTLAYFLGVSPGWIGTMKMHLLDGRDFRESDTTPGSAIINQAFAKEFFPNQNPLGKIYARGTQRFEVVGIAADAPYRNIREPVLPVAYVPFHTTAEGGLQPSREQTFVVRTTRDNPLQFASFLRREVAAFRPEFRVSNVHSEEALIQAQAVRERLLALLATFFAGVALLLAAIGLYGVLDYSVFERSHEIGIRRAIGAPPAGIARLVTVEAFAMVLAGAVAGLVLGLASARYVVSLLYEVKPTQWGFLALPAATILMAAVLAALPAAIRAIRIDPAKMLRAE
jgi:predicted permease